MSRRKIAVKTRATTADTRKNIFLLFAFALVVTVLRSAQVYLLNIHEITFFAPRKDIELQLPGISQQHEIHRSQNVRTLLNATRHCHVPRLSHLSLNKSSALDFLFGSPWLQKRRLYPFARQLAVHHRAADLEIDSLLSSHAFVIYDSCTDVKNFIVTLTHFIALCDVLLQKKLYIQSQNYFGDQLDSGRVKIDVTLLLVHPCTTREHENNSAWKLLLQPLVDSFTPSSDSRSLLLLDDFNITVVYYDSISLDISTIRSENRLWESEAAFLLSSFETVVEVVPATCVYDSAHATHVEKMSKVEWPFAGMSMARTADTLRRHMWEHFGVYPRRYKLTQHAQYYHFGSQFARLPPAQVLIVRRPSVSAPSSVFIDSDTLAYLKKQFGRVADFQVLDLGQYFSDASRKFTMAERVQLFNRFATADVVMFSTGTEWMSMMLFLMPPGSVVIEVAIVDQLSPSSDLETLSMQLGLEYQFEWITSDSENEFCSPDTPSDAKARPEIAEFPFPSPFDRCLQSSAPNHNKYYRALRDAFSTRWLQWSRFSNAREFDRRK